MVALTSQCHSHPSLKVCYSDEDTLSSPRDMVLSLCVLSCLAQCNDTQTLLGTGQHILFLLADDLIFLHTDTSCALSCLPPSF